jgi:hypothetical protein
MARGRKRAQLAQLAGDAEHVLTVWVRAAPVLPTPYKASESLIAALCEPYGLALDPVMPTPPPDLSRRAQ